MTPQEIFNTAYLAVIGQGRPSTKKDGACAYRGENGAKCAIGHLIDDATANRWDKYESNSILTVSQKAKIKPDWLDTNLDLLTDIQNAHDMAFWRGENFVRYYKERMFTVAEHYDLTVPELSA